MKRIKFVDNNLVGQPGLCPHIDPGVNWTWSKELVDYDIGIYTDTTCYTSVIDETKENYAWIIEPSVINGENYRDIANINNKFIKVFSHTTYLADRINNFHYLPHGGTWLREHEIEIPNKSKNISYIFSDKQWNPHHKLRHRVYEMYKDRTDIDFYGSGCNKRVQYKSEGLTNYRFSIVIENCEEDVYFTEKLLDCLLTGTVPIYVGSGRIGEFFNAKSILKFKEPEQLKEILDTLTPEFYDSITDSIQENFAKAKQYIHPEQLIQKCILT